MEYYHLHVLSSLRFSIIIISHSNSRFIYLFLVPSEQTFMKEKKCRHYKHRGNHSHIIINDTTHNKSIRSKWKRIRKNEIKRNKIKRRLTMHQMQPKQSKKEKKNTKKSYIWLCLPPFLFHPPLCFSIAVRTTQTHQPSEEYQVNRTK